MRATQPAAENSAHTFRSCTNFSGVAVVVASIRKLCASNLEYSCCNYYSFSIISTIMKLLLNRLTAISFLVLTGVDAAPSKLERQRQLAQAVNKNRPDTGMEWSTTSNGIEFQPASDLSPKATQHLRRLTSGSDSQWVYQTMFADGKETYFDEYAQAWRALGFYIDCDYEGEQVQGENNGDGQQQQDQNSGGCQRFMLWAAVSAFFTYKFFQEL